MQDLAPSAPPAAAPADPADAGARPWRRDEPLPHPWYESERYGYLVEGRVEPCDRRELARHLAKHPQTPGVYVPGTVGLTRPEQVPGLLDEYRAQAVRRARNQSLWLGLATAAGTGFLLWSMLRADAGFRSLPGLITVFCAAYLLLELHGIRVARRAPPQVFARARQIKRHWDWAKDQSAYFTWFLALPLGITFFMTAGDSAIPAAALVKPAVWDGEAWRMLTGPMMHGGFYHLWMNLTALVALGRITEAHAGRFHLAIVFLVSVIGGSVLSVLLTPRTSVGASGGVMGLVGFLWVMARLRPSELPDDFGERMQYVVGATALLGVIGFEFIDNWAHLGGLLAGAGMGWLLLRDGPWERRDGLLLAVSGSLSLMILWCAMAGAVSAAWSG